MPDLGEKLARLFSRTAAGIKFDLRVVEALLERLGHPERACVFIHVAGTNGKGSVCAMLDSILRAMGLRTGLYTSPHLVRFNERIQVEGVPISDEALAELFDLVEPLDEEVSGFVGRRTTFFELTTAMALEFFRRQRVECVVLETGMGGRLDATNVVTPLVSVITRIDLEHCQYLGRDIEQIAAEKAGIIKAGRPVVCGAMAGEAEAVVRKTAAEKHAPFLRTADLVSVKRIRQDLRGQRIKVSSAQCEYPPIMLPLLGRYQLENAATAVAASECAAQQLGQALSEKALQCGLESVRWPARCQVLRVNPTVLLDVAHNPCGARALAETLRELEPKRKWALVFSLLADKDAHGFVRELSGCVERAWIVPLKAERAASAESLKAAAVSAGWPTEIASLADACRAAVAHARARDGSVCIAGSLYLAGELLAAMEKREILWDV